MTILSSNIKKESISLSTSELVGRLILTYGVNLDITYEILDVNSNDILITKEDLGLDSMENIYFKLEIDNQTETDLMDTALYEYNVENDNSSTTYQADVLKHELDNLNYYDGVIKSLTTKRAYRAANEMFYTFINFLESFYGNNHLESSRGQNLSRTCN